MADDGCVDKDEGRFGDELAEGRQARSARAPWPFSRRLVERASVGPLLTFVFAPACGVPKPSRRVVSPELVALASEESMGTLTRISRLTALRKHLLWARNVIPRLSTKLSPVCG